MGEVTENKLFKQFIFQLMRHVDRSVASLRLILMKGEHIKSFFSFLFVLTVFKVIFEIPRC